MNYDIAKLMDIKKQLDDISAELQVRIEEFEEDLKKLAMGVEVWTKLSENIHLGYCKINGTWHVTVRYSSQKDDEVVARLVDAPRTLRLYGYKNRMLLLPALEKAAESLLRRISKVINLEDGTPNTDEDDE